MWIKFDSITGVLLYELDPIPYIEIDSSEISSWKESHNLHGAAALSCIKRILEKQLPSETFAEASARLGYGNGKASYDKKMWYYDRNIYILSEYDCNV